MSRNDWLAGHWWKPDPSGPGMVHRVSGEAVLYRGLASEASWHLFEYRYGAISYPLVVQFKTIEYPHPNPVRIRYRADWFPFPEKIEASLWIVDHERSVATRNTLSKTSYGDWYLADVAIREVALLWDEALSPLHRADELCAQAGFLNGTWHKALFRRFVWDECVEEYEANLGSIDQIKQLPATAFGQQIIDRKPPVWRCIPHLQFDGNGTATEGETTGLINETNGMKIGIRPPVGQRSPFDAHEAIRCRLGDYVSAATMAFFSERYEPSAIHRFHAASKERWNAPIWKIHSHALSKVWSSEADGEGETASGLTRPGNANRLQSTVDELQSRFRYAELEREAYEQSFPLCQPLSEKSCLDNFRPDVRQVDIHQYPIGGKIAARASIRTSIKANADAPLTEWVKAFGETE